MGQTLTHGVYLPDEGERNCYSGLASNWQILDSAVGTVADHTTALSGKAPLVHTHTKSDITDFPAYGTTAGTICEGNDSRLSDARTPVAHTHTKSDVTDLLNSNFIPSANNSYDLGSSSYQWNNTYAKQYYLNGVAFGDIATHNNSEYAHVAGNETIAGKKTFIDELTESRNTTNGMLVLQNASYDPKTNGQSGVSTKSFSINFTTALSDTFCSVGCFGISDRTLLRLTSRYFTDSQTITEDSVEYNIWSDGTRSFRPRNNNNCNLGESSRKWKDIHTYLINGNNPGALSLPVTAVDNAYDINGNITNLTGGNNAFSAPRTGWVFIRSTNATSLTIVNNVTGMGSSDHSNSATTLAVCMPVTSGESFNIVVNCTSLSHAYLLPCQGNV